jgi:galactokinase
MRKNTNVEHIEGRVYQHTLELKTVQNKESANFGKEYIQGSVEVAVDDAGLNIIPVNFVFVTETTKKGGKNKTYSELQKVMEVKALGDLTEEAFEANKGAIDSEIRTKRAKHAVYENQRTVKAVSALIANEIDTFGELMNASHVSLRDDYEVTGKELDTLAAEAWKQPGVVGARMTGAGFGGCTVNLVKEEAVEAFIENVGKAYKDAIGYAADFYVVDIGSGPCKL